MPVRKRGLQFEISAEDRTDRAFRSLNRNLDKTQGALRGLRGPMGALFGTAAVAGIAAFTKKAIDAGDAIAKTADKIGITTDALQEYSFVADRAGLSQERFNKGAIDFTRRLGELRQNTGSLVTFLNKYDTQLLSALRSTNNTTDALELIIEAMAGARTEADRAALGYAAFGRAGVDMGLLAKQGADEIERLRQVARDSGIVIREDLLRSAEAAKDELALFGKIISSNLTAAMLELAPLITDITGELIKLAPAVRGAAEGVLAWAGAYDAVSADRLLEELDKVESAIENQQSLFKRVLATPSDLVAGALGWSTSDELIANLEERKDKILEALIAAQAEIEAETLGLGRAQQQAQAAAQGDGAAGVDPFGGEFRKATPRAKPELPGPADITPTTAAIREQIETLERLNAAYAISEEQGRKVENQLEREAEIRRAGKNLTAEQINALDQLLQKRQELEAIQEKRNQTLESEIDKQSQLNDLWQNETLNILGALRGGYQSWEQVALGVLERVIGKLFEYVDAANAAAAAGGKGGGSFFDFLGGLFSGGGTSFPASAAAASGVSVTGTGGMLSGPIPRQGGGPVEPGRLFEVAERTTARGLFMPIERGGVFRQGMGRQAEKKNDRGATVIEFNANFSGMDDRTMRNPMARSQMAADIRDLVQDATRDV